MLMSQKESGFGVRPVLNALRSAAVMALPPRAKRTDRKDASKQGRACDEERVEVDGEEHEEVRYFMSHQYWIMGQFF